MQKTHSPTTTDRRPPTVFDRALARRRSRQTSLDLLVNVLEAVSSETHELTVSVQLRVCDLNPAARPRLEERARKLARIRDLADVTLAALARAGVEPTPADQTPPLVQLGPGGDFTRTSCEPPVLGQRLDLEA